MGKVGPLVLAAFLFGCAKESAPPKPIDLYKEHLRVAEISIEKPVESRLSADDIAKAEKALREYGIFDETVRLVPGHTAAYSIVIPPHPKGFIYIFGENHVSRPGKFNQYLALEELVKGEDITLLFGEGGYGPAKAEPISPAKQYSRILKERKTRQTVTKIAESYGCRGQRPCVDVHYVDDPELVALNFVVLDAPQGDFVGDIRSIKAAANIDKLMECHTRAASVYGDSHSYLLQNSLAAHGYASVTLVSEDMHLSESKDTRNYASDVKQRKKRPPRSGWHIRP